MKPAERSQLEQWRRSIAMGPEDAAALTRNQALDLISALQRVDAEHRQLIDALHELITKSRT